jgi:hypothetical protein
VPVVSSVMVVRKWRIISKAKQKSMMWLKTTFPIVSKIIGLKAISTGKLKQFHTEKISIKKSQRSFKEWYI